MTLQHPVPAAEVAGAEAAVPYDPLRRVFAVFEAAADLLRRAAADRQGHVHSAVAADVVVCQGF